MASNKMVTLGPVFITSSAGSLFGPPSLTLLGGANNPPPATTWISYYIIRHIRIVNKNASARTVTLYKDVANGSTSGQEVVAAGLSIPGNSYIDWYGAMRIQSDETNKFITGIAGTDSTSLVIQAEAEVGIV